MIDVDITHGYCICCGAHGECLTIDAERMDNAHRYCNTCWSYIVEVAPQVIKKYNHSKLVT